MTDNEKLIPLTIYLSPDEKAGLEREAKVDGRSGVSAQIRYILRRWKADGEGRH